MQSLVQREQKTAGMEMSVHHGKVVKAEVIFGAPNADCRGLGICRVVPRPEWRSSDEGRRACHRALAFLTCDEEGVEIFFIRRTLCAYSHGKYFRDQQFVLQQPITLPKVVCLHLDLPRGTSFRPGIYAVRDTADWLVVRVNRD